MRETDLNIVFSWLRNEIGASGVMTTPEGYPMIPDRLLLKTPPDDIVDWTHRNMSSAPAERTAVCFYLPDGLNIRRILKLRDELDEYRRFMGACGFDLSPCSNADPALQRFNLTLSQMATVWLGLHGVPVIPNFRAGDASTFPALKAMAGRMVSVGTVGCERDPDGYQAWMMRTQFASCHPSMVLLYGSPNGLSDERFLEGIGVPARRYVKFDRRHRMRSGFGIGA